MTDDPWAHSVKLVLAARIPTSKYVHDLTHLSTDDVSVARNAMHFSLIQSQSSRRLTYKILNPDLTVHSIYNKRIGVNEVHRISFTQFRLSGHNLKIETGRWNRRGRGRLPIKERLCQCGEVQTELHVVQSCPLTQHL